MIRNTSNSMSYVHVKRSIVASQISNENMYAKESDSFNMLPHACLALIYIDYNIGLSILTMEYIK